MGIVGEIWADAGLKINQGSFAAYAAELNAAESKISKFSSTSQTMMASAFLLPAGVVTGVAAIGTQIASGFQDAGTTLTTLYGSADVAREKFQWLAEFAANTPFEFPELLEATNRLKAYGIEAEQYMGVFGDTAAAMGKGIMDVVEAVADAQTGEFERMKEFGIKAAEITKKNYAAMGASAEQVGQTGLMYTDKFGKQQLAIIDRNNREMITSTISAIWNDKYAGAMETRSKTLSGMWSTLKDNMSFALADLIGYDMKNMEVQTLSLMGVMQGLMGVAVQVTGSLSSIPEPIQAIIAVTALGVTGIGLLAAGFIAYGAILPLITADTAIFGVTLSAAIWPVTAVVGGLALLAAGLVYLEEKTGLVSTAFQVLSDVATIAWDYISNSVSNAIDFFSNLYDEIMNIVNAFLETQNMMADFTSPFEVLSNLAGGFVEDLHGTAEGVRNEGKEIKKATDEAGQSTVEAAGKAEQGSSVWGKAWDTLTGKVTQNNDKIAQSNKETADKAKEDWDKTLEKMYEAEEIKMRLSDSGMVNTGNINLNEKLRKGVMGKEGVLGFSPESNELVIQSVDGTIQKLNELDSTQNLVFHGMDKNYAIIIDDGTRTREQLDEQAQGIRAMGMELVIVKKKTDDWNISLTDATSLNLAPLNNQFSNVITQEANVSKGAREIGTWLQNVNNTSMSNAISQLDSLEKEGSISTEQARMLKSWLINVNNSSQANATSQIAGIGSQSIASNGQVGGLKTGLVNVNSLSMAGIMGQITGIGSQAIASKSGVDQLFNRLTGINSISFSSVLSGLSTISSSAKSSIDNMQSMMSKANELTNIANKASNSVGAAIAKSSDPAFTARMIQGALINQQAVTKIGTYNNNSTSVSKNSMRAVT